MFDVVRFVYGGDGHVNRWALYMEMKSETVRFEVLVNGERRCIAGIDGLGVLTTITKWVMRDEDRDRQTLLLHVGGHRIAADQSVKWITENISTGDEVTIRVLGPGDFDEPSDGRMM